VPYYLGYSNGDTVKDERKRLFKKTLAAAFVTKNSLHRNAGVGKRDRAPRLTPKERA
jgi:hypothetical protein